MLAAPDRRTEQGRRDYALLLFLYNTGARASEAFGVKVADPDLNAPSVKIHGKGGKRRYCPIVDRHRRRVTDTRRLTEPLLDPSSSIAAANPSLASGSIPPSSVMASRSSAKCRRWRESA
ncbi:tyrosine-type recombinase/integrase [Mesorhizobium sp. YC-39]|uniref:tyrosine-type recombinase/integrase n=1 Tax=unclassified Mesorhizobium TaxID=325217 RepID=UPI0039912926